jgi:phage terminase large subunit GpA-like protein
VKTAALWKPKKQTPDQWARENRIYGPATGWPGPREPSIAPYNIPFARAMATGMHDGRRYSIAVLCEAAQGGKTEAIMDAIGERMDNRPANMLYVGPSELFNKQQFEPRFNDLVSEARSLRRKMIGGSPDSKKQTKTLKRFAGGRLRLAHAGSSMQLKSDPAAIAFVDEYDEMLANVKKQGDPLGLVTARGDTFADFITGVTSTPSVGMVETEQDKASGLWFWKIADPEDIKSPIWRLWQSGTRHHWCWPCLHCDRYFVVRADLLSYPEGATPAQASRNTHVACPNCGGLHDEGDKPALNARGRYVAPGQTIDVDGVVTGDAADVSTLSFWASGLASPFVTFGKRVETYLTAIKSRESDKMQTAVNSQYGELFVEAGGDLPPWEEIMRRRSPYKSEQIPAGARWLTCGIDVQKNRLVFVVRAWGRRASSWLVKFGELHGDTTGVDVWNDLRAFLAQPIGGKLIKIAFIDSGFRPGKRFNVPVHAVYAFARMHRRFVYATKGSSTPLVRPIVQSKIEVKTSGKLEKYGLDLMRLDPDHWKSFVHERLGWPQEQDGAWLYPDDVTEHYCKALVAEVRIIDPNGKPKWIERSKENHFLDAEALAAAAANLLNAQYLGGRKTGAGAIAESVARDPDREAVTVEEGTPLLPPPSNDEAEAQPRPTPPPVKKKRSFADLARKLNR